MNLTLHLVRKDLRHFRLAALFWAVLVVAQVILTNRLLSAGLGNNDWYMLMCGFVNLLYFIGLVFGYLFAGVIVLSDAPAGSVSHWQTLPISGGRLLTAKAIVGFLILGALPLALWMPWWIYCGFGLGGVAKAAALILTATLIPVVVGVALAAVVDQIGRFMMLSMILVAAVIVFAMTSLVPNNLTPTLFGTRLLLCLVCLLLAALVTIGVQYRTRQVVKSGAVLVAGVVAILLVRAWWPVDLIVPVGGVLRDRWYNAQTNLPGAEKVEGRIWRAEAGSRNNKDGLAEPYVTVFLSLTGVPEEVYVADGLVDVELDWPDGTKVRREKLPVGEDGWMARLPAVQHALKFSKQLDAKREHWDPETQAKQAAAKADFERRQAARYAGKKRPGWSYPNDVKAGVRWEIPVSPAIAEKIRLLPPVCRIVASLQAKRPVILGETSFVEGASIVENGRLSVAKLQRAHVNPKQPGQLDVQYAGLITLVKPPFSPNSSFYLIDRIHETTGEGLSYSRWQGIPPLAGSLTYHPFWFSPPALWRTDKWVEITDWLKTYTLVEEESRPAGSFTYALTTERLELVDPPQE